MHKSPFETSLPGQTADTREGSMHTFSSRSVVGFLPWGEHSEEKSNNVALYPLVWEIW